MSSYCRHGNAGDIYIFLIARVFFLARGDHTLHVEVHQSVLLSFPIVCVGYIPFFYFSGGRGAISQLPFLTSLIINGWMAEPV